MVKRYTNWCFVSHGHDMMESEHGSFVRFDDIAIAVAALMAAIPDLEYGIAVAGGVNGERAEAMSLRLRDLRAALKSLGVEWEGE